MGRGSDWSPPDNNDLATCAAEIACLKRRVYTDVSKFSFLNISISAPYV
jgi:hypothetical protein